MAFGGGGFSGPARRYQAVNVPTEDQLTAAMAGARSALGNPGGTAHFDTSLLDDQAREEDYNAHVAQDPAIQRTGFALSGMPQIDERVTPDSSDADVERIAMQPRRFTHGGQGYEYNPRVAGAIDIARQRASHTLQGTFKEQDVGLEIAGDDARVQRLVSAGYSQKEATRQVFGRAGATPEEQSDLIQQRGAQQLERDKSLQDLIGQRQLDAERAREAVSMMLEKSRSGDRSADRGLRAALGLLDSADRAHAAALRDRQRNALGLDLEAPPSSDDPTTMEARNRVSELDASDQALGSARRAVETLGSARGGAAPPAGGGGGDVLAEDELTAIISGQAPAGTKKTPAKTPVKAPTKAAPAAAPAPAKKKPTAEMLQHAKADADYRAFLLGKGYDLGGSE